MNIQKVYRMIDKYLNIFNDWIQSHEWIMRGIEVIWIIWWIIVALLSMSQINHQISQIQQQIDQWAKQNNISELAYEKWKRFEEIKLLQEISLYFETEPNRSILEFMRTKNSEKLSQYWDFAIVDMLNKFEYLAWIWEENEFKDSDIDVNFEHLIVIICNNPFATWPNWIINLYWPSWYSWVRKLCDKWWWRE